MPERLRVGFEGHASELAEVWGRLLDVHVGPDADAQVDAFSDYEGSDELPDDAAEAMAALRDRKSGGMGVKLDLGDREDRALVQTFSPYAIHTLVRVGRRELCGVHDGTSLWVEGSAAEIAAVRRELAETRFEFDDTDVHEVDPLDRWRWPIGILATVIVLAVGLWWLLF